MTNEELQELKDDMRQQMKEEIYEEQQMRIDIDYAYEKLGLDDIYTSIKELSYQLADYGYDVSIQEIIDRLEEI